MHESMFTTFLKVASQNDRKAAEERQLVDAMKSLPPELLFKIASGEKLAYLGGCEMKSSGSSGSHNLEWLEEFKDTPLFEQALQLEQQAIQIEQMQQQYDAQRSQEREQEPKFWEMQDRIRLQKRLLGLQLASSQLQQAGAAAAPGASAGPTAGAPAPPPPSTTEAAGGAAPGQTDGKVASDEKGKPAPIAHRIGEVVGRHADTLGGASGALTGAGVGAGIGHALAGGTEHNVGAHPLASAAGGLLGGGLGYFAGRGVGRFGQGVNAGAAHAYEHKEAFDHAAEMGRKMAHGDYGQAVTTNLAAELGRDMAKAAMIIPNLSKEKRALDMGAVAGLGRQAAGYLGRNPGAAAGMAMGGAAGLAHGLQKDQNGQRHILGGLAEGAAGAVGGGVLGQAGAVGAKALQYNRAAGMALPAAAVDAAKTVGQRMTYDAGQAMGAVRGAVGAAKPGTSLKPGFAPPNMNAADPNSFKPGIDNAATRIIPGSTPQAATQMVPRTQSMPGATMNM